MLGANIVVETGPGPIEALSRSLLCLEDCFCCNDLLLWEKPDYSTGLAHELASWLGKNVADRNKNSATFRQVTFIAMPYADQQFISVYASSGKLKRLRHN